MRFGLSEEQQELTSAVRTLVERRSGQLDLRAAAGSDAGYDTELWQVLCTQIGVTALAIPGTS